MRKIKFRGLTAEGKWVYGYYYAECENSYIIEDRQKESELNRNTPVLVFAETVSQFTGLKDKNGAEIYEGDILSDYTETDEGIIKSFQQVYWCEKKGAWMLDESYKQDKLSGRLLSEELEQFKYEISGNIYENLELIKK